MTKKSNTFEIIIIIILVVIIVYVLIKLNDEKLDIITPKDKKNNQDKEDKEDKEYKEKGKDKKVRFLLDISNKLHESTSDNVSSDVYSNITGDVTGYDDKEVNNFLDEYINYSRFRNKPREKKSAEEDINHYRQSYLDFNNMINRTSNGYDAVDRMNEVLLDKDKMNGMTIGEIYDRITTSNFDSSNIHTNTPQNSYSKNGIY